MKIKRYISKIPPILIFYIILIISSCLYIRGKILYYNMENWPSTKISDLKTKGETGPAIIKTGYGAHKYSSVDARRVTYRYIVNNIEYMGARSTANSASPPMLMDGVAPTRAYYNPSHPQIAVLSVEPYRGTAWILLGLLSITFIIVHLYFHFRPIV